MTPVWRERAAWLLAAGPRRRGRLPRAPARARSATTGRAGTLHAGAPFQEREPGPRHGHLAGRHRACRAGSVGESDRGNMQLRRLDDSGFTEVPGTAGGRFATWSADGRSIAFIANRELRSSISAPRVHDYWRRCPSTCNSSATNAAGDFLVGFNARPLHIFRADGARWNRSRSTRRGEREHPAPSFFPMAAGSSTFRCERDRRSLGVTRLAHLIPPGPGAREFEDRILWRATAMSSSGTAAACLRRRSPIRHSLCKVSPCNWRAMRRPADYDWSLCRLRHRRWPSDRQRCRNSSPGSGATAARLARRPTGRVSTFDLRTTGRGW